MLRVALKKLARKLVRKKVKKFAFDHCKTCSEHYEELAQEQNIALANFPAEEIITNRNTGKQWKYKVSYF